MPASSAIRFIRWCERAKGRRGRQSWIRKQRESLAVSIERHRKCADTDTHTCLLPTKCLASGAEPARAAARKKLEKLWPFFFHIFNVPAGRSVGRSLARARTRSRPSPAHSFALYRFEFRICLAFDQRGAPARCLRCSHTLNAQWSPTPLLTVNTLERRWRSRP